MEIFVVSLLSGTSPQEDAVLSSAEQLRVSTYLDIGQQAKMTRALSSRREILSHHSGIPAHSIEFEECNGKPHIKGLPNFYFNTSYSSDKMCIGISSQPIGIDLEKIVPASEDQMVSQNLFHPMERAYLNGVIAQDRLNAFFAIWTQKEAFAKGIGRGFGMEFSEFSITPTGGFVQMPEDALEDETWFTQPTNLSDNYVLSVASTRPTINYEIVNWSS